MPAATNEVTMQVQTWINLLF